MLLCRAQLDLAPNRTIARPSKTQGRATQDIQSSIHPGSANPTRLGIFSELNSPEKSPDTVSSAEAPGFAVQ
jgi:hypothetical protein